jgi:hypothetical protein
MSVSQLLEARGVDALGGERRRLGLEHPADLERVEQETALGGARHRPRDELRCGARPVRDAAPAVRPDDARLVERGQRLADDVAAHPELLAQLALRR